jgi:hypothetical protein
MERRLASWGSWGFALAAGLVVACGGSDDAGGSGGAGGVPGPGHGLAPETLISAISDEDRINLCADALGRLDQNKGPAEQECTTMFVQTNRDGLTDPAACQASVDKCLKNGVPRHGDLEERKRTCSNTLPPLLRDTCKVTIGDYDACMSELFAAHTKNLQAVSCKDPSTWKRLKSAEAAPACKRVSGPGCGNWVPSSF